MKWCTSESFYCTLYCASHTSTCLLSLSVHTVSLLVNSFKTAFVWEGVVLQSSFSVHVCNSVKFFECIAYTGFNMTPEERVLS